MCSTCVFSLLSATSDRSSRSCSGSRRRWWLKIIRYRSFFFFFHFQSNPIWYIFVTNTLIWIHNLYAESRPQPKMTHFIVGLNQSHNSARNLLSYAGDKQQMNPDENTMFLSAEQPVSRLSTKITNCPNFLWEVWVPSWTGLCSFPLWWTLDQVLCFEPLASFVKRLWIFVCTMCLLLLCAQSTKHLQSHKTWFLAWELLKWILGYVPFELFPRNCKQRLFITEMMKVCS